MVTISPEVTMWIVGGILAVFLALIKLIRFLDKKQTEQAIDNIKSLLSQLDTKVSGIEKQAQNIESKIREVEIMNQSSEQCRKFNEKEIESLSKKQNEDVKNLFSRIDDMRETMGDMRETMAGFGSQYVSRKEYYVDKNNKNIFYGENRMITILVVDTNKVYAKMVANTLTEQLKNAQVDIAISIWELRRRLRDKNYSVILADISVAMDGEEMLCEMKKNGEGTVVLWSSLDKSHVKDLLKKPLNKTSLKDLLPDIISSRCSPICELKEQERLV